MCENARPNDWSLIFPDYQKDYVLKDVFVLLNTAFLLRYLLLMLVLSKLVYEFVTNTTESHFFVVFDSLELSLLNASKLITVINSLSGFVYYSVILIILPDLLKTEELRSFQRR